MLYRLNLLIASGFGSGFSPKAPGTAGTFAALLCWYLPAYFFQPDYLIYNCTFAILSMLIGLLSSRAVMRNCADKDPQFIVIDEWAGLYVSLLLTNVNQPLQILAAFLLFRSFDIIKPGPVSAAEKLSGAAGVMLDDIVAGVLALLVLTICSFVL